MLTVPLPDRIRGCLLGGAVGDALGAPVEFMTTGDIVARYGPRGIADFDIAYGRRGAITDDTQMTLFTVDGLIRARVRGQLRGIVDPPSVVHHAYIRWLATQLNAFTARATLPDLDGWLIDDERLWSRRAPGMTCISALKAAKGFGIPAENDSKGCGTVMRDAPWGLASGGDPDRAYALAAQAARTTHGHPTAARPRAPSPPSPPVSAPVTTLPRPPSARPPGNSAVPMPPRSPSPCRRRLLRRPVATGARRSSNSARAGSPRRR